MSSENVFFITETDYEKLSSLLNNNKSTATKALDTKLANAEICAEKACPSSVVRLNSPALFRDAASGSTREVSIVMPWESDITKMKISVLSPVGAALLGSQPGATVDWPLLHGKSATFVLVSVKPPKTMSPPRVSVER